MKKTVRNASFKGIKTVVLSLTLAGLIALPASAQEGAIKYRQSVMKAVGAHYSAMDSILKGKGGQIRDLKVHAKALAALEGLDYVTPDHVKEVCVATLRHRVMLDPAEELEGVRTETVLERILDTVEVPR